MSRYLVHTRNMSHSRMNTVGSGSATSSSFSSSSSKNSAGSGAAQASQDAAQSAQNGGHCASPYLRRFRLPKLNTIRGYDMEVDDDDEDEWVEIQMAKSDLINTRMKELQSRLKEIDVNVKNNNNNNNNNVSSSCSSSAASPSPSPAILSSFASSASVSSSPSSSSSSSHPPSSSSAASSPSTLTNANSCKNIQRNIRQHQRNRMTNGYGETPTPFFHPKHLFASSSSMPPTSKCVGPSAAAKINI